MHAQTVDTRPFLNGPGNKATTVPYMFWPVLSHLTLTEVKVSRQYGLPYCLGCLPVYGLSYCLDSLPVYGLLYCLDSLPVYGLPFCLDRLPVYMVCHTV